MEFQLNNNTFSCTKNGTSCIKLLKADGIRDAPFTVAIFQECGRIFSGAPFGEKKNQRIELRKLVLREEKLSRPAAP